MTKPSIILFPGLPRRYAPDNDGRTVNLHCHTSMKIAIMSDSHEHWDNLRRSITLADGCDVLLFAGDLMAPGAGLAALKTFHGPVHMVF